MKIDFAQPKMKKEKKKKKKCCCCVCHICPCLNCCGCYCTRDDLSLRNIWKLKKPYIDIMLDGNVFFGFDDTKLARLKG